MPWYWILIILSAIFGPFEAMHALNKARQNREAAEKKREEQERNQRMRPGLRDAGVQPADLQWRDGNPEEGKMKR